MESELKVIETLAYVFVTGDLKHLQPLHWHQNTEFYGSWREATIPLALQIAQLLGLIGMETALQR